MLNKLRISCVFSTPALKKVQPFLHQCFMFCLYRIPLNNCAFVYKAATPFTSMFDKLSIPNIVLLFVELNVRCLVLLAKDISIKENGLEKHPHTFVCLQKKKII